MPDEYEIKAVMDNTGCTQERAIKALEKTGRIGVSIENIKTEQRFEEAVSPGEQHECDY